MKYLEIRKEGSNILFPFLMLFILCTF